MEAPKSRLSGTGKIRAMRVGFAHSGECIAAVAQCHPKYTVGERVRLIHTGEGEPLRIEADGKESIHVPIGEHTVILDEKGRAVIIAKQGHFVLHETQ